MKIFDIFRRPMFDQAEMLVRLQCRVPQAVPNIIDHMHGAASALRTEITSPSVHIDAANITRAVDHLSDATRGIDELVGSPQANIFAPSFSFRRFEKRQQRFFSEIYQLPSYGEPISSAHRAINLSGNMLFGGSNTNPAKLGDIAKRLDDSASNLRSLILRKPLVAGAN